MLPATYLLFTSLFSWCPSQHTPFQLSCSCLSSQSYAKTAFLLSKDDSFNSSKNFQDIWSESPYPFLFHVIPFLHLRLFWTHSLIVPSCFKGKVTHPHNQGDHLWSQLCVGLSHGPLAPCIYILSVFPSAGSFPSLCNHVNYLWPGDHVVHAPSARSRPKCSLLFISIFLSVGMPPAHSVLFITQLFLNFSPSYSLTSHKSGFPPQWFHFYCTSSQSC